jgi:chromosome segregation ATPase
VKKDAEDKQVHQNEGPTEEKGEEDTANDHDDARKSNTDDSGVEKLRNFEQRRQNVQPPSSSAQPSSSVSSTDHAKEDHQTSSGQSVPPNFSRDEIGCATTSLNDNEKYWKDTVADLDAKLDTEMDEKESILSELVDVRKELAELAEKRSQDANDAYRWTEKYGKANAMKRTAETELRRSKEKYRKLEADSAKLQNTLNEERNDFEDELNFTKKRLEEKSEKLQSLERNAERDEQKINEAADMIEKGNALMAEAKAAQLELEKRRSALDLDKHVGKAVQKSTGMQTVNPSTVECGTETLEKDAGCRDAGTNLNTRSNEGTLLDRPKLKTQKKTKPIRKANDSKASSKKAKKFACKECGK